MVWLSAATNVTRGGRDASREVLEFTVEWRSAEDGPEGAGIVEISMSF